VKVKISNANYKISEGEYEISLGINYETDEVTILNEHEEKDFLFKGNVTAERMQKWAKVFKLMNRALEIIDKEI